MAGHSHWAGIKHKKGRQDKLRSKIFSKISREITVAAKLGSKDPDTNHRLRAAIEIAKDANMPKENINRAISKSENHKGVNFQNLRYEGFGPKNIALIIETLTDNKNRTAGNIRKNLHIQKFTYEGENSNWLLISVKGILIQIFTEESRKYYNIEDIYFDSETLYHYG